MFQNCSWPGIIFNIRSFVRNCDVCGKNEIWKNKKQGFLKLLPIPSSIWSEIFIDFVTDIPENEGCTNFLSIKGVILKIYDSMEAKTVAEIFIYKFYSQNGLPSLIISNRGR